MYARWLTDPLRDRSIFLSLETWADSTTFLTNPRRQKQFTQFIDSDLKRLAASTSCSWKTPSWS